MYMTLSTNDSHKTRTIPPKKDKTNTGAKDMGICHIILIEILETSWEEELGSLAGKRYGFLEHYLQWAQSLFLD